MWVELTCGGSFLGWKNCQERENPPLLLMGVAFENEYKQYLWVRELVVSIRVCSVCPKLKCETCSVFFFLSRSFLLVDIAENGVATDHVFSVQYCQLSSVWIVTRINKCLLAKISYSLKFWRNLQMVPRTHSHTSSAGWQESNEGVPALIPSQGGMEGSWRTHTGIALGTRLFAFCLAVGGKSIVDLAPCVIRCSLPGDACQGSVKASSMFLK